MTADDNPERRSLQRGTPNQLAEPLPVVDGTEWGPAMKALPSDRHRAFVLALYQVKPGHGSHVAAAKLAGFGTSTSSPGSWSVIACRLAHDERIMAALHEEDKKRIRASAPRAIRALERLIEDPKHKDHARGIGMVLDRVHPQETVHRVEVKHEHTAKFDTDELIDRLGKVALTFGLDSAKVLACPQTRPAGPVIDGECTEVTPRPPANQRQR